MKGDDVLSKYPVLDSLRREQQFNFVNENGLFDVILDSRNPEAKQFRKWVTSEVLPSIRKHGAYMTTQTITDIIQNPDNMIRGRVFLYIVRKLSKPTLPSLFTHGVFYSCGGEPWGSAINLILCDNSFIIRKIVDKTGLK